jgi:LPXTG-motif cell wall-anchored protein
MFNYKSIKMKKVVLMFSILGMLFFGSLSVMAQDENSERKDTISIDNADPVFYDAEDEGDAKSGGTVTILAIAGGVVLLGAGAFFLLKKKK